MLQLLLTKAKFWLGALLNLMKKNIFLRLISKSLGLLVATTINIIDLFLACKSLSFSLVILISVLLVDIVITSALLLSGVGGWLVFTLGFALGHLKNKVVNYFKESPVCQ